MESIRVRDDLALGLEVRRAFHDVAAKRFGGLGQTVAAVDRSELRLPGMKSVADSTPGACRTVRLVAAAAVPGGIQAVRVRCARFCCFQPAVPTPASGGPGVAFPPPGSAVLEARLRPVIRSKSTFRRCFRTSLTGQPPTMLPPTSPVKSNVPVADPMPAAGVEGAAATAAKTRDQ